MSWLGSKSSPAAWSVDKIPDLKGKVFLVTGGYGGIGLETTRQILKKGGKVYIAGRSKTKYHGAFVGLEVDIKEPNVHFLELDLADLKSVKKASEEFLKAEDRLDVLLNNAGVLVAASTDRLTKQGYELTFGTNTLGHYYLTKLLLPILEKTGSIEGNSPARVIDVVTDRHRNVPNDKIINYESLKGGALAKKLGGETLYAQSKAGNILYSQAFSRHYKGEKVVFGSLHPGVINTEIMRDYPAFVQWMVKPFFKSVKEGAVASLYAATALEPEKVNGAYLLPGPVVAKAKEELYKADVQDALVKYLDDEIKHFEAGTA